MRLSKFKGKPILHPKLCFYTPKSVFRACDQRVFLENELGRNGNIRNVWKLPSPFSSNTLITSFVKTFWSLKHNFGSKIGFPENL
jgi:hypothetical protein